MLKEGTACFQDHGRAGRTVSQRFSRPESSFVFLSKDDTPGCTKEACSFRDAFSRSKAMASTYGVSISRHHTKSLPQSTTCDHAATDTDPRFPKVTTAMARKSSWAAYMGVKRNTFLIDEKGKSSVSSKVKPEEHAEEVLKAFAD